MSRTAVLELLSDAKIAAMLAVEDDSLDEQDYYELVEIINQAVSLIDDRY